MFGVMQIHIIDFVCSMWRCKAGQALLAVSDAVTPPVGFISLYCDRTSICIQQEQQLTLVAKFITSKCQHAMGVVDGILHQQPYGIQVSLRRVAVVVGRPGSEHIVGVVPPQLGVGPIQMPMAQCTSMHCIHVHRNTEGQQLNYRAHPSARHVHHVDQPSAVHSHQHMTSAGHQGLLMKQVLLQVQIQYGKCRHILKRCTMVMLSLMGPVSAACWSAPRGRGHATICCLLQEFVQGGAGQTGEASIPEESNPPWCPSMWSSQWRRGRCHSTRCPWQSRRPPAVRYGLGRTARGALAGGEVLRSQHYVSRCTWDRRTQHRRR